MAPRGPARAEYLDVAAALDEQGGGRRVSLDLMLGALHDNGEES
jgi:hypothetical protein